MINFEAQTLFFEDDGRIPNHPELPVLFYPRVLKGRLDQTESIFNKNNWLNSWTNGVFDYHHYHSNTHEVLGVVGGTATLKLGGEHGQKTEIIAGDVVVLPAGTGHINLSSSPDFKVVGAYPDGINHNMRTGEPEERAIDLEMIKQVTVPSKDPVFGDNGPLSKHW